MKQTFLTLLLALLLGLPGIEAFAHDGSVKVNGTEFFFNIVNGAAEITYKGDRPSQNTDRYTGSIAIPKQVSYKSKTYPVTSIGVSAFDYCSGLTSITIPNSVTNIGDYAFRRCSGLTSVTVLAETLPTLSSTAFVNINLGNITLNVLRCLYNEYKSTAPWNQFTNIKARHDVAVANDDSKTIFYNYVNNKTALEVTYQGSAPDEYDEYTGKLVIPSSVTYNGNDYPVTGIASAAFSGCSGLTELDCHNCRLTSLDVSGCTALTTLKCNNNQLTSLDVSKNTALTGLWCYDNQLTSLDVSKNTALQVLACGYNKLTSLDVSKNTALEGLGCYNNRLTSLDVSKNTALTSLHCYNNQLTSLDVSKNAALTGLWCYDNQLTSLDVSKNTALKELVCGNNQLTSLDVTKNTALTSLSCYGNQLTTLDVSKNTALKKLYCVNNQIQGAGMATLIENLPTVTNGEFYVYNTDGTDGNRITTVQVAAAKAKGWIVKTSSGGDYAGVPGIAIDGTNFPDENFRAYVSSNCDTDKDTYLSDDEIAAVTEIDVRSKSISNLKGIEYFTALTNLYCSNNQLTALDVSKNTALRLIECYKNKLRGTAVDNLISSLPRKSGADLNFYNNETSTGNSMTSAQVQAAKQKGWTPRMMSIIDGSSAWAEYAGSDAIAIDATNFPDDNFRSWVYINCDKDLNYSLTVTEIAAVTSINVSGKSISNLKGIEYFTALKTLSCYNNQLTTLDLSNNTALEELSCYNNQLTSLNVSGCTALKTLYCHRNQIRGAGMSAFVDNLPNVTNSILYTYTNSSPDGNEMTTQQVQAAVGKGWSVKQFNSGWVDYPGVDPGIAIDATNFPDEKFREYVSSNCDTDKDTYLSEDEIAKMTSIAVGVKGITDLKGIEYFTALKYLDCFSNQLTALDVSKNTTLTYLFCHDNQLTSLDVSNNTALTGLECDDNQLTTLDVSKNTALTTLWCSNNQLTSLDVSKNTALKGLYCFSNQLTSLDVSKNTALQVLYCYDNQLTSLDVSKNTALTGLDCSYNQLTSLDVSNNTALTALICFNNQIRGAGMATLIENLPTVTGGDFYVYNTDGTDGNRITTVQVVAAKAKGWSVETADGDDYPGINVPGDANGDGEVNATDITTVRDYILGLDPKPFSLESANLNGDSTVDIADLTKLIQLLTE